MIAIDHGSDRARTVAVQRALQTVQDQSSADDLLFLEALEIEPAPGVAAALRVTQIRRANPQLAAEIRAELERGRPLTTAERGILRRPSYAGQLS